LIDVVRAETIVLLITNRCKSNVAGGFDIVTELTASGGDETVEVTRREALIAREALQEIITLIIDALPAIRSAVIINTIEGSLEGLVAARGFFVELSIIGNSPDGVVNVAGAEVKISGDFTIVRSENDSERERSTTTVNIDVIISSTSVFTTGGDLELADPVIILSGAPDILQKVTFIFSETRVSGEGGIDAILRFSASDADDNSDGLNGGLS
jgi:hypothetical protein